MMRILFIVSLLSLIGCGARSSAESQPNSPAVAMGNEGANAGDSVAQEATTLMLEVVATVEQSQSLFPEVAIGDLRAIQQRVRVTAPERTFVEGVETDAKNNGKDHIEINRTRWLKIPSTDRLRKLSLVFHELLNITGLEVGNYSISSRLMRFEFNFAKKSNFLCTGWDSREGETTCEMSLQYDLTSQMFLVDGIDGNRCYWFQGNGTALFRKKEDRGYVAYPELANDSNYKFLWNEMIITSDRNILFFSRNGKYQIKCRPSN